MIADRLVRKHNDSLHESYGSSKEAKELIRRYELSDAPELSVATQAQLRSMYPEQASADFYDERLEQIQDAVISAAQQHGSVELSQVLYHAAASDNEFIRNSANQALSRLVQD